MFPICHIYFAGSVFGGLTNFSVLGSIYPDAVISGRLKRDITHYNTGDLYSYFESSDGMMKEFAQGAASHGVDMKGLDYYSDEKYPNAYKGYCFEKGKSIEKEVIDCCRIPEEWGLWKAHNFIEMAFELYLDRKNGHIKEQFKRALTDRKSISYISRNLSLFYGIPADYFEKGFCSFSSFFDYEHMNERTMAEKYSVQLYKKHGISNMDICLGEATILKAVDIISHDAQSFLDYAIDRFKVDFPV